LLPLVAFVELEEDEEVAGYRRGDDGQRRHDQAPLSFNPRKRSVATNRIIAAAGYR
jgi:hypothetical protein